jgi:hypothetical protein
VRLRRSPTLSPGRASLERGLKIGNGISQPFEGPSVHPPCWLALAAFACLATVGERHAASGAPAEFAGAVIAGTLKPFASVGTGSV